MVAQEVQKQHVKIDVTSDAICPFCVLGLRNLQQAISLAEQAQLPLTFEIQFHPFQLDPTLGETPVDKRQRYISKFGKQRFDAMEQMMIAKGKQVGVNFSYGGTLSQTTTYHRLITHAWALGGQSIQLPLVERLFKGYFEDEKDPSDLTWLATEATAVGIFPSTEAGVTWLQGTDCLEEVYAGYQRARDYQITGVPFLCFAKRYAVSGAQPVETFYEVFAELSKGEFLSCTGECPLKKGTKKPAEEGYKVEPADKDELMC